MGLAEAAPNSHVARWILAAGTRFQRYLSA